MVMRTPSAKAIRRRHPSPGPSGDGAQLLSARIADLELRLKLLEARMRDLVAAPKTELTGAKKGRARKVRDRCPGCVLELPAGPRGSSCVWCGFKFEAVGRAFR